MPALSSPCIAFYGEGEWTAPGKQAQRLRAHNQKPMTAHTRCHDLRHGGLGGPPLSAL